MTNENKDRLDLGKVKFWWEHCGLLGNGAERMIDWLIREVDRLGRLVDTYDILELDVLRREIDSLTKERDKYKMEGTGISMVARNRELEAEVERLHRLDKLKSCNCNYPNWTNTGGSMKQCSHCGGWNK